MKREEKFIMKAFIVFFWETAVYWIVGWPWPLICMNWGAGEAVLFREAVQHVTEKARFCSQAARSASYKLWAFDQVILLPWTSNFLICSMGTGASLGAQWQRICPECRKLRFNPWVGKIPRMQKWQPTLVLLPGKSPGQRSLMSNRVLWGLNKLLCENCAQGIVNVQ